MATPILIKNKNKIPNSYCKNIDIIAGKLKKEKVSLLYKTRAYWNLKN